jgi:Ca2+-binding RTX toxin-like protein
VRPIPLVATGLLAAALLTSPTAYAAGETCQGSPATVVGTPNQAGLTGTEGPDVVVTNGSSTVDTLGGNDLVCVTGRNASTQMSLDTGVGDDVVDGTASTNGIDVELGAGRDSFTGSAFFDSVSTGPLGETDQDTVQLGSSADSTVSSGGYGNTAPNPDVVLLGPHGGFVAWYGPMAPGARLDGGGAPSTLVFAVGSEAVLLDAAAGTLAEGGRTVLTWRGFDRFYTARRVTPPPSSFTFRGTDRAEELGLALEDAHRGDQDIDMGGGADTLLLGDRSNIGAAGSSYVGGPGKDNVSLWAGNRLDLDLASGRMRTGHDGRTIRTRLTGFESHLLGARNLVLKGTKKADVLGFFACRATVHGRAGKDEIAQNRGDDFFEGRLRCNPRRYKVYGDGGDDTLRGSHSNDLLIGGPGRDTIIGNGGRDTCSGEKLTSCEIKLR